MCLHVLGDQSLANPRRAMSASEAARLAGRSQGYHSSPAITAPCSGAAPGQRGSEEGRDVSVPLVLPRARLLGSIRTDCHWPASPFVEETGFQYKRCFYRNTYDKNMPNWGSKMSRMMADAPPRPYHTVCEGEYRE